MDKLSLSDLRLQNKKLAEALQNCVWHMQDLYNNVHDGDTEFTLIQQGKEALNFIKDDK